MTRGRGDRELDSDRGAAGLKVEPVIAERQPMRQMQFALAGATVDRLLHHAHVCVTTGDSVRLQQATSGKGVIPLP